MQIATWNINSVKARLPNLLEWLAAAQPDVLLLQEIKCQTDDFPLMEIRAAGYQAVALGQKSYNGVAILSRHPIEDVRLGLPGDDSDEQARYIEATVRGLRIGGLYLPNGNPAPGPKYDYKLAWMARLRAHAEDLVQGDLPVVLTGDYNVCPTDFDVYDPIGFATDALCLPASRAAFRALLNVGFTEAYIALHPNAAHHYTFWDYQGRAFERGDGLRIDHFLLSGLAADRLEKCEIDVGPRGREKASDHTPVICTLRD
ncbi:MAG: exodeoxyribonuclease III [Alphaproteobacteria bacterium]|jgi:exodeoxyribonuclease-3|nr:exodeoxyribonuclease III [Alphaproteobacteria bacterium]